MPITSFSYKTSTLPSISSKIEILYLFNKWTNFKRYSALKIGSIQISSIGKPIDYNTSLIKEYLNSSSISTVLVPLSKVITVVIILQRNYILCTVYFKYFLIKKCTNIHYY